MAAYTPPSYNPRRTPQKSRKSSWRYEQPPTLTERLIRALAWSLTMLLTLMRYLWRELWISPYDEVKQQAAIVEGDYPSITQLFVWFIGFGIVLFMLSRIFAR